LSGAAIGLVITLLILRQILKAPQLERDVSFVAEAGTVMQCIADRPLAIAGNRMFIMMTLVFA
jgi:hypothetical protein